MALNAPNVTLWEALVYHSHYLYRGWSPCERPSSQAGQRKKPSLEGACVVLLTATARIYQPDTDYGLFPTYSVYRLSPSDRRRAASIARSWAALAPYLCSICLLDQPASLIRSVSWPPSASHLWA